MRLRLDGVLLALCLCTPARAGALGGDLEADLRVRALEASGDGADLRAFYAQSGAPAVERARALYAALAGQAAPLDPDARLLVLTALADPAPEVRVAALRAVGRARERTLEGEALKRLAEDGEPRVRVEALRAVRPWSRQGHLYFLQQALSSPDPWVQAETLINLGAMAFREIPPEMVAWVERASGAPQAPEVRLRAFQTLRGWGRLEWPPLRDVLLGGESSEALRLLALEAGDVLAPSEEKGPVWLAVLDGDPSPRLAWEAFQRLKRGHADETNFLVRVGRYLGFSGKKNFATDDMASLLRSRGYRAEYRSGAWKVGVAR